ncbi:hypothetical protein GCM10011316_24510 [Roseibium aquae]|uniref:Uncharacterized protein n=1 Tax=Roseibium aquae TaxID=1323746 RepID=A0A916TKT8_9HYPH|nr:hypothetical protein [Roseibium aquae]GGB51584.1 hypothetical protein GCM10011316_24510 [Roseibium aquae]
MAVAQKKGGVDPFDGDEATRGPAPFAIGFERANGTGIVFGAAFLAVVLLAIGLASGQTLLAFAALAPLGIALWHYPMIEKGKPQLGANPDGLFVERIGFIDWGSIRMIDLSRTSVRNIELVKLNVLLNRSLDAAVAQKQKFPFWKTLMMRNWKVSQREHGRSLLSIDLHTLTHDPDEIVNRIRAYGAF